MKTSCIITPTVKVGNKEVVSELFQELINYTNNRKAAQELWALSQVKEFTDSLPNLEYDENGEPTFESFAKAINIKLYLENDVSLQGLKQEAGAINKKGEEIKYNEASPAIDRAVKFNEENPLYVASVKKGNKYSITVEKKTADNSDEPKRLVFNRALNNKLLGILRSIGFDVQINENSSYSGVFNPLEATTTAEGLRTVIQIAKGQRGEQAFPEEFSHVMIAGLKNHPLVRRLMDALDMPTVALILGEKFDEYSEKYKGDEERLRKEAAGLLLLKHIVGEATPVKLRSLLSRLWNWIKDKFKGLNESYINEAINEANIEAGKLAEFIMSDEVNDVIDPDLIMKEETLYSLEKDAINMESIANEALKLMSKRLKILTLRSKSGRYREEDMEAIKYMQDLIERKKYAASTIHFLQESLDLIQGLYRELKSLLERDTRSDSDLGKIRRMSYTLRSIKDFTDAYEDIIRQLMALPEMATTEGIRISEKDAKSISDLATKVFRVVNSLNQNYTTIRFNTVFNFLKLYWGKDKLITMGKNKGQTMTLEMIMKMADKDINGLDTWISSLADASDPMLSLVYKIVRSTHAKRDNTLNKIVAGIRAAHKKLVQSGTGNTEFMFERDKNGKLTGRLISDIDFNKFNEERQAVIDELKKEGKPYYVIKSKIEAWERRHMATYPVEGSTTERTEVLPSKELYGLPSVKNRLTPAQYEYYKTMMEAKALLEDLLPLRYVNTYNAVQISKDMTAILRDDITNPKKALSLMRDRMKSKFLRRVDDTGFGEETGEKEKRVKKTLLNFANKPILKLPVYYTTPLENPDMLSTDFTSSLMAYAGMAINYGEMNKVIDVLELTRDFIKDREVQEMSGDEKVVESFKILHKKFSNAYTSPGKGKNIGRRIDEYFASVIYDQQKKDEGTIKGTKLDVSKTLDTIKSYTGAVGLGLNLFSGISNILAGKIQIFIEAIGGEYFNYKNALVAKKNYYKDLPEYLAELNSSLKKSKMGLLIEKFDALESFYDNLRQKGYYKGPLSRIIGNANLFILNNMGEHYLHVRTMYAMLDAFRVKSGSREISLYDALDVVENDGEYSLKVKDGITAPDGSTLTDDIFIEERLKIGRVNQSLNGAFSDEDKGLIHRYALGRLAMLFRQWMPAHYYRRFAKAYWDATLDQLRLGFYVTTGIFLWETMKDLARAKFQIATRWNELTEHQKANLKRALAEIGTFAALSTTIMLMGPEKDKKGVWYDRMIAYQLKRMKLEVGASTPITPAFIENIFTILKSPSASINSVNNILDCFCFWTMFNEIESGRYKGWSEWERDVSQTIPIYGQIRRAIDLTEEDYLFTMLNQQ